MSGATGRWATAAALAAVLAAGCASMENTVERFKPRRITVPTVKVTAARMAEASDDGIRMEIMLMLSNPNDEPLPLTRVRYTVRLGGAGQYEGDTRPNTTLPAGREQELILPAAVATSGAAGGGAVSYTVEGAIEYLPPGEVRELITEMGVPLPKVDFSGRGTIGR